jgi:hypothetical protein
MDDMAVEMVGALVASAIFSLAAAAFYYPLGLQIKSDTGEWRSRFF